MPDAIDRFVSDYANDLEAELRDSFDFYTSRTESPIEALFISGMGRIGNLHHEDVRVSLKRSVDQIACEKPPVDGDLWIFPQAHVCGHRVDFVCLARQSDPDRTWRLVVECDGHDFHERTKEQASRDRERDRRFQDAGYTVYRFTGAELHRNLYACCKQVIAWARSQRFSSGGADSA